MKIGDMVPLPEPQTIRDPSSDGEDSVQSVPSRLSEGHLEAITESPGDASTKSSQLLDNLAPDRLEPHRPENLFEDLVKIDVFANAPPNLDLTQGLDPANLARNPANPTAKEGDRHYLGGTATGAGADALKNALGATGADALKGLLGGSVLNAGKPAQPNPSAYGRGTKTTVEKSVDGGGVKANSGFSEARGGGSHATPPPGAELSFRAPKWDQVGLGEYKPSAESQRKQEAMAKAEQAERQRKADEKEAKKAFEKRQYEEPKPKEYVDPDAGGSGGGVDVSAEDISRIAKVHFGSVEHGINPDLGVGDGPTGELKHPIDLLRDPSDDGEASVETLTPGKATLAADIHGPDIINPDSGFDTAKPDGVKGGADPNEGGIS